MLLSDLSIGQVVKNTSGRDADKLFFIVKILNDDCVLISDGKKRKLEKLYIRK